MATFTIEGHGREVKTLFKLPQHLLLVVQVYRMGWIHFNQDHSSTVIQYIKSICIKAVLNVYQIGNMNVELQM